MLIPPLVQAFREASDRDDMLRRLVAERGFYVPSFYDVKYADNGTIAGFVAKEGTTAPAVVRKAALRTTDAADPPATRIFTPETEFGSRFLIEVVRGCANLCRFCWAGYNYLPVRPFRRTASSSSRKRARQHSNRVGLVSIALCDHPDIEEILTRLVEMGYSISPASLRLDDLTPTILRLLRESGERTITIAPETGSDRLRRVINKTITNDEILAAADLIFATGFENLKLYFMIGIPTETDEDLVAIRDLTLQLRDIMLTHARPRGQIGRIVGSVNPLVPKPGTAYQWLPMEDDASVQRKIKRMHRLMADIDNVYFNIKSERHSFYQALLSLGDRRVAPAIEAAERNGGNWRAAVKEAGIDADFYVFRDRSNDGVLPWDIIDGGMKDTFFRAEAEKSMKAEWTLPPKRQKENARLLAVLHDVAESPVSRLRSPVHGLVRGSRVLRIRVGSLFEVGVRLQHHLANAVLFGGVAVGGAEQREGPALAVDRVLTRRKCDVAAAAGSPLPHGEANQLHAFERAFGEVDLRIGKLAGRVVLVIRCDSYDHGVPPSCGGFRAMRCESDALARAKRANAGPRTPEVTCRAKPLRGPGL